MRFFCLTLFFLLLPLPGLSQDAREKEFTRRLRDFNEACMLGARQWRAEVHEPLQRAFCDRLLGMLEDQALSREEAAELAGQYAELLDRLRLRQARDAHRALKKALQVVPVPAPTIEELLSKCDARLLEMKSERARQTTAEGLLEQYGDKNRLDRDLSLFRRERPVGYGSGRTKEVEHLLNRYRQSPLEALPDTGETELDQWNRRRVLENIFSR